MEAQTKKYLTIGGIAVVVLSGVGFGLYKFFQKKGYQTSSPKAKKKEAQKLVNQSVNYGTEGYVNVRSSPRVDNENWKKLDFEHNLIAKVKSNPVGTILERIKGEDGYFWYRISLSEPVNGKSEGFVREDAVVLQG